MSTSDNSGKARILYDSQYKIDSEKITRQMDELRDAGLVEQGTKIVEQLNAINSQLREIAVNTANIASSLGIDKKKQ